jgi:peptidase S41-like protein
MRAYAFAAVAIASLFAIGPARAALPQIARPSDPAGAAHWRALTELDLKAARDLLARNHPGAAPELGDKAFVERLARGYAEGRGRIPKADSYEAYVAVMAAFANGFGDKHIWARQDLLRRSVDWPGFVVALRGDAWTIVADDEGSGPDGAKLTGSKLLSCDGVAIEAYAAQRLGTYRAVWSIPAQRVSSAPWLLADEANPFTPRPTSCDVQTPTGRTAVALTWRSIPRADFAAKASAAAPRGAPGFGVGPFAGGVWISLQSLDDRAQTVVEAVERDAEDLRKAPAIVLDLRGNGGGASGYGRRIADALLGEAYTAARLGAESEEDGCEPIWRASQGNLDQLDYYRRDLAPKVGPEFAAMVERARDGAIRAREAHRELSGDPAACRAKIAAPPARPAAPPAPAPAYRGKLVLLTDTACFSSCLLVADDFRKLGARHVGEATDANTHYMEVREAWMPSGLTRFSTLQAVGLGSPRQVGPFVPGELYGGDISDTKALEAWITTLVASSPAPKG